MTDFYKMDPAAWDFGTANLTLEQEAAYLRVINAIHKHKAAIPFNDRIIAGLFRCSTRKARSLLDALVDAGKLRIEDGLIVNDRAISDLVHRGFVSISRAESGAKGGRTRAENAAKPLENNDHGQAIASIREEKRREENIPPISPKGDFAGFWEVCPRKVARGTAEKAYAKALKKTSAEVLRERMAAYAASVKGKDPQFIRHPATWLNGEGWLDHIETPPPTKQSWQYGDTRLHPKTGQKQIYQGERDGWILFHG